MSVFGDGTIEQDVLDALQAQVADGIPALRLIEAVSNVLAYLAKRLAEESK